MKLDALTAFTQASYRNMKSYFTSKLIEHIKCFVEYLLYPIVCLAFEVLFTTILHFFNI